MSIKEVDDQEYIEELTFNELVDFISDLKDSSDYLKSTFDYDDHIEELISRSKRGNLVTRQNLIKVFNNLDKSEDHTSLFKVDLEEFLDELGL